VAKTIHHAINITTIKAELFTIRCRINQAIHITNVLHIIVITDAIYSAKKIFDSFFHPYQVQYIVSQISYSLVVILELNSVLEVQYKEIMIIGDE